MDDQGSTLTMAAIAVLALLIAAGLAFWWIGGKATEAIQDARITLGEQKTEQMQAEADRMEARADLEREHTEQQGIRTQHSETMFYAYVVALKAFSTDPIAMVLLVMIIAGGGVYLLTKPKVS